MNSSSSEEGQIHDNEEQDEQNEQQLENFYIKDSTKDRVLLLNNGYEYVLDRTSQTNPSKKSLNLS